MKQANTKSELEDILTHFSRLAKMRSSSPDSWQVLLDSLLAWHQQELERAMAEAYRKGYQAGWSTGDSGGRTTKREEVKAKREAWISKKMKEKSNE